MKISEILHMAADEYLWDGCGPPPSGYAQNKTYSCLAISELLCEKNKGSFFYHEEPVFDFLKEMGIRTFSSLEFSEFKSAKEIQGARYLWLKFAALVAEDEGL